MTDPTVNLCTSELVVAYPFATDEEIDALIEGAHSAFLSCRSTAPQHRSRGLARAAEVLLSRTRAFAEVSMQEMGKITTEGEAEVERALTSWTTARSLVPRSV